MIKIKKQVLDDIRAQIINVIQEYKDVFAYTIDEMPSIDPLVMVHRLNIKDGHCPVKQKLWHHNIERSKVVAEEIKKLLAAGFIREC